MGSNRHQGCLQRLAKHAPLHSADSEEWKVQRSGDYVRIRHEGQGHAV